MGTRFITNLALAVVVLLLEKSTGFSPSAAVSRLRTKPDTSFAARATTRLQKSSVPSEDDDGSSPAPGDRRQFLDSILKTSAAAAAITLASSAPAEAFEKAYPVELDFVNGDTSRDIQALRQEAIAKKKQKYKKGMDYATDTNPLELFRGPKDIITTTTWGGALWLLTGSRSNPLVTPLANALYVDAEDQKWLKDRNDGLFASLPIPLYAALIIVFFGLGFVTDRLVLYFGEGSSNISLQLAGLSLISGGYLELGRLASGEKRPTRDEFDRTAMLRQEFVDFADARLKFGGSCHRNDVVRAFRRYYGKYRQEDSEEYPLTNLEIEKLLKEWSRVFGNGRSQMTSAGFYNGLSVNEQADVFTQR